MAQKRSNKILGSDSRSANKTVEWKEYRAPHGETRTINEKSIPKYAQNRITYDMPTTVRKALRISKK